MVRIWASRMSRADEARGRMNSGPSGRFQADIGDRAETKVPYRDC